MFAASRKNNNRPRPKSTSTRKRSASKEAMLDQEYEKLHAKIGVLEDFITKSAVKQDRTSRMRASNILPPPEQWRTPANGSKSSVANRRSRWQKRQEHAQRDRSGLTFLVLFTAACAIALWLLKTGF